MTTIRIPVIGFVAPSGSGKTTLLAKLVPVLRRRGLRVGYLKHAHHTFDLDVPGKDSYEIREAGAQQTLLASSERWALQVEKPDKGEDPDLQGMLARFEADRLDLILVEGFKHEAFPKIELHRPSMGQRLMCLDDPNIIALATDAKPAREPTVPLLDLNRVDRIGTFVLDWLRGR